MTRERIIPTNQEQQGRERKRKVYSDISVHPHFRLKYLADLATERERQLTTARANKTTGLTNGRAAN